MIILVTAVALCLVIIALMPLWSRGLWRQTIVIALSVVCMYGYFGSVGKVNDQAQMSRQVAKMAQVLQTESGQVELTARLRHVVSMHPKDAQGWYWLGRVLMKRGEYQQAIKALSKAHELSPNISLIAYQLAQARYLAAGRHLDPKAESLLKKIIAMNPYDKHALNLLATAAYENKSYAVAVKYWQELLKHQVLASSDQAWIRQNLNEARKHMAKMNSAYRLTVVMPDQECLPKSGFAFIVAKAKDKRIPPLAVKRIDLSQAKVKWDLTKLDQMIDDVDLNQYARLRVGLMLSDHGKMVIGRQWRSIDFMIEAK